METELQELIMNIENDDGNGWMKAGLPELGAPPFLFLSMCKESSLVKDGMGKVINIGSKNYMS